jgi:hypothetical protein
MEGQNFFTNCKTGSACKYFSPTRSKWSKFVLVGMARARPVETTSLYQSMAIQKSEAVAIHRSEAVVRHEWQCVPLLIAYLRDAHLAGCGSQCSDGLPVG